MGLATSYRTTHQHPKYGSHAGTAEERTADLLWALQDDSILAIICSRGGYGSMHLLSHLPQTCFLEHPKWLIGHGDITILLHASVCNRVIGIHGPMTIASRAEGILVGGNLSSYSAITRSLS